MCDCYTPQGVPIPTNKRHNAAKIFNTPKVAAEETWYEYLRRYFKFFVVAVFHIKVVVVLLCLNTHTHVRT